MIQKYLSPHKKRNISYVFSSHPSWLSRHSGAIKEVCCIIKLNVQQYLCARLMLVTCSVRTNLVWPRDPIKQLKQWCAGGWGMWCMNTLLSHHIHHIYIVIHDPCIYLGYLQASLKHLWRSIFDASLKHLSNIFEASFKHLWSIFEASLKHLLKHLSSIFQAWLKHLLKHLSSMFEASFKHHSILHLYC